MDQFPIDLGAHGGFNGRVVNTAENTGFWPHLDAIAGLDIAFYDAVQDDIGDHHRTLDASLFAHRERRAAARLALYIAVDVAVEMKSADELNIAVDPGLRADQRRFRFSYSVSV